MNCKSQAMLLIPYHLTAGNHYFYLLIHFCSNNVNSEELNVVIPIDNLKNLTGKFVGDRTNTKSFNCKIISRDDTTI